MARHQYKTAARAKREARTESKRLEQEAAELRAARRAKLAPLASVVRQASYDTATARAFIAAFELAGV